MEKADRTDGAKLSPGALPPAAHNSQREWMPLGDWSLLRNEFGDESEEQIAMFEPTKEVAAKHGVQIKKPAIVQRWRTL